MATPGEVAKQWLYETFAALPSLVALGGERVWRGDADDDAETPFIRFELVSSQEVAPLGAFAARAGNLTAQWAVYDDGNDARTIEQIAAEADAATRAAVAQIAGHELTSRWIGDLVGEPPWEDGEPVVRAGAELELFIAPLA